MKLNYKIPTYFGLNTRDIPEIEEMVGLEKKVSFYKYYLNNLYFLTEGMIFPIPVAELGEASIGATERSMLCLKWIKREQKRLLELYEELQKNKFTSNS